MDWFKIKVGHVLNSALSDEDLGRLVKIQALTALKERAPTPEEMSTIMRPKTADKLDKNLQRTGVNLPLIVEKVLEDVIILGVKRGKSKKKKALQRDFSLSKSENVPRDVPGDVVECVPRTEKRREEKRREDNTIEHDELYKKEQIDSGFPMKKDWGLSTAAARNLKDGADTDGLSCVSDDRPTNSKELAVSGPKNQFKPEFNRLWLSYPVKDGKKAAMRHFLASVKNIDDLRRCAVAVENYLRYLATTGRFPKNGATFFNNWEDFEDVNAVNSMILAINETSNKQGDSDPPPSADAAMFMKTAWSKRNGGKWVWSDKMPDTIRVITGDITHV